MRILVVGCGSVGKRHLGNLLSLGHELLACDTRPDRQKEIKERFPSATVCSDIQEAFAKDPEAVFVCTPPSAHMQVARLSLEHSCHVFVEKPLSDTLHQVDEVIELSQRKNLSFMVGYTYRFSPALRKVKQLVEEKAIGKTFSARICFSEYLPDWHPWEDYRTFYMAKKSLGGGALLDESHTVDFARWFFGEVEEVFSFNGKVSSLEIETDDLAELLLRFQNGVIATIHLDLFGRAYRKTIEVMGEEGNIEWDFYRNEVRLYLASQKKWEIYPYKDERNAMFLEEAKYFVECALQGRRPFLDGEEGKKTLQVLLAARESSQRKQSVAVKPGFGARETVGSRGGIIS